MKTTDIVGFAAILAGGYYAGQQGQNLWTSNASLLLVAALLVIGFYFAVILS